MQSMDGLIEVETKGYRTSANPMLNLTSRSHNTQKECDYIQELERNIFRRRILECSAAKSPPFKAPVCSFSEPQSYCC
jgi:hypothetical protein